MHDMKKCFWLACVLSYTCALHAQHLEERLSKAVERLQQDAQLKHAILGISIVKTETGEKVFELNAQTGLAPASCQKTITSAAAMELLGHAYRYTTTIGYNGDIDNGTLKGNLILTGSGDPTFGSWRYDSTRNDQQLARLIGFAKNKGINRIDGGLIGYNNKWEAETIPGGWIWDDMGNYYGSGTTSLNWHENQYDLVLRSGSNLGDKVSIVETRPKLYEINLQSQLTSAAKRHRR
jgi:D-alanyl-D-alanine carboxypeptidase/D-alanyl-D-alanine-endopeptidase (penicillin-binding protein 4)